MKYVLTPFLIALSLTAISCDKQSPEKDEEPSPATAGLHEQTDALLKKIASNVSQFKTITTIDHSRLAAKEKVPMPPSVVTIYSDPAVNTALMKLNPRVGLDLPLKVLVYEEDGKPMVTFPPSSFIGKRHGISDTDALEAYDSAIAPALNGLDEESLSPVNDQKVVENYGIIELISDYPLAESITRLKNVIMKEGDTAWFGEIDFKAESTGGEIPGATLLLFGAPKPGGMAMAKFPKLGLDAFCQKILVYEDSDGSVKVIFNGIVEMAKLHYGTSAKPHEVISGRLMKTFTSAVKKGAE